MRGRCSLSDKCCMFDPDALPCIDYAGRLENRGERAPCYINMTQQLTDQKMKSQKESYLCRAVSYVIKTFLGFGGIEDQDLD